MKLTKKLLTTIILAVLSLIIICHPAYATELVIDEELQILENSEETFYEEIDIETEEFEELIIDHIEFDEDEPADEPEAEAVEETPAEVKATTPAAKAKEVKQEKTVKKPSYSEKDLRLLSALVYSEAGNQSYKGMLAVANVVINRMKSKVYSHVNTIEEVIYDRKWAVQFAVTVKNKKTGQSMMDKALKYYDTRKFTGANPEAEKKAMNRAIKAAKAALEGENNIGDYLCFQNKRSANSIKRKYSDVLIIGDHIFYRTK